MSVNWRQLAARLSLAGAMLFTTACGNAATVNNLSSTPTPTITATHTITPTATATPTPIPVQIEGQVDTLLEYFVQNGLKPSHLLTASRDLTGYWAGGRGTGLPFTVQQGTELYIHGRADVGLPDDNIEDDMVIATTRQGHAGLFVPDDLGIRLRLNSLQDQTETFHGLLDRWPKYVLDNYNALANSEEGFSYAGGIVQVHYLQDDKRPDIIELYFTVNINGKPINLLATYKEGGNETLSFFTFTGIATRLASGEDIRNIFPYVDRYLVVDLYPLMRNTCYYDQDVISLIQDNALRTVFGAERVRTASS